MHAIFIGGSKTPIVTQPDTHTWRPSNQVSWTVRDVPAGVAFDGYKDPESFPLVDQYVKPKPMGPRPITNWEGSWAQSLENRRLGVKP